MLRGLILFVAAMLFFASPSSANHASFFSHGPSMPFTVVEFDSTGDASYQLFPAGVGYSLNFNFLPGADGSVRWLTLGYPFFVNATADNYTLRLGVTLGTYNNLLAIGAAFDLVDTLSDTGALLGDFSRENVRLLFSLNFNLGGGTPEPVVMLEAAKTDATQAVHAIHASESPPCYVRFK